jgi:hypothetical protein
MQGRILPVRGAGGGAERKPAVIHVRDSTILHEEFLFLTKNGRDFLELLADAEFNSGLVIIIPN